MRQVLSYEGATGGATTPAVVPSAAPTDDGMGTGGEEPSEGGDDAESAVGSTVNVVAGGTTHAGPVDPAPVLPAPPIGSGSGSGRRGRAKPARGGRARPRKSGLAQEISFTEDDGGAPQVEADAEVV